MREGESNPELWLHWSVSCPSTCVESQVRYRKQGSNCWKELFQLKDIPSFHLFSHLMTSTGSR
uniref:Uncharacterized protein n=1 Tax=Anguilla anguilla TaxID=7936 RepID=A0A0E9R488_ANGAN